MMKYGIIMPLKECYESCSFYRGRNFISMLVIKKGVGEVKHKGGPAFTFTVPCFPNRGVLHISINVIASDTAAKCTHSWNLYLRCDVAKLAILCMGLPITTTPVAGEWLTV